MTQTIQQRHDFVYAVFHDICTVLHRHQVRAWLDQGALLGIVRDNAFIPYDTDIDFGIRLQDVRPLFPCLHDFQRLGYETRVHGCQFAVFKDGFHVSFAMYQLMPDDHYVHIDYPSTTARAQNPLYWRNRWRYRLEVLYDAITYNGYRMLRSRYEVRAQRLTKPRILRVISQELVLRLWHLLGSEHYGWRTPRRFYDELDTLTVQHHTVYVPCCTEQYLTFKYGDDWHTPRATWNYLIDDGASIYHTDITQYRAWHTLAEYREWMVA